MRFTENLGLTPAGPFKGYSRSSNRKIATNASRAELVAKLIDGLKRSLGLAKFKYRCRAVADEACRESTKLCFRDWTGGALPPKRCGQWRSDLS